MILVLFVLILFLCFYLVPLLVGYLLGRIWPGAAFGWGGWIVTGGYAAWMVATWIQEGYAPGSMARLVSLEPAASGAELYRIVSHLTWTLLIFCMIYFGARRGSRMGSERTLEKKEVSNGTAL